MDSRGAINNDVQETIVKTITPAIKSIASGLRFPEGPVAMNDGSVVLVEIERRTLSRVTPDGKIHVVATLGGGPNGAAMGPNGKIYVTNEDGVTSVVRSGPKFEILAENDFEDYTLSSAAVSEGQLFIRTASFLWAIGERRQVATR